MTLIYKDLCKTSNLFKTGEDCLTFWILKTKQNKDAKLVHVKVKMKEMKLQWLHYDLDGKEMNKFYIREG